VSSVYQAPQTVYLSPPAQQYQQQIPQQQQPYQQGVQQQYYSTPPVSVNNKDKGIAILLYIFLGEFGAHYFYASNVSRGLICFLYNIALGIITSLTFGLGGIPWLIIWIVGLVQLCNWQVWLTKHSK
jgi:TM2 domain-containing membrane protein YozV